MTTTTIQEIPGLRTLVQGMPPVAPVTPEALLATPEGFRRWLNARPHEGPVGTTNSSFHCPIATYLKENFDICTVGGQMIGYTDLAQGRHVSFGTPVWAARFIRLVDRYDSRHQIRASLAIALLYQATEQA